MLIDRGLSHIAMHHFSDPRGPGPWAPSRPSFYSAHYFGAKVTSKIFF